VTRQFAPRPNQAPADPEPEDEGPGLREKYLEAIRGFRSMRGNFHDKLSDAAGLGSNEEEELEQLVSDWKRLKRGDR